MIENTCTECGLPCEIVNINESPYWDDGYGARKIFMDGDPVSDCCKADFEPMSIEEQVEYDEEQRVKTF